MAEDSMKILLIDDDEADRMVVKKALQRLEPLVVEAVDLKSGHAALLKDSFNVILTDYILGDGNALDFVSEIRKKGDNTPVIMISGSIKDEKMVLDTIEAGVLAYIPKDKLTAEFLTRTILMKKQIHILLVDDDEVDRKKMIRCMAAIEAAVTEATDCEQAITTASERKFDLLILDYKLPDCNGLDLSDRLLDAGVESPIVLVTGFGSEDLVVDTWKKGIVDYMPKDSITPEFVTRTVLNAISIYKTNLEKQKVEEDYKNLYNLAPVGLCRVIVADGRLARANLMMARMLGCNSQEDILHKRITDFFPESDWAMLMESANVGTRQGGYEQKLARPDGKFVWAQVNFTRRNGHIDVSFLDVTSQKKLERELIQRRKNEIEMLEELQRMAKAKLSAYDDMP